MADKHAFKLATVGAFGCSVIGSSSRHFIAPHKRFFLHHHWFSRLPTALTVSTHAAGAALRLTRIKFSGTAVLAACWWVKFLILMKL